MHISHADFRASLLRRHGELVDAMALFENAVAHPLDIPIGIEDEWARSYRALFDERKLIEARLDNLDNPSRGAV